MNYLKSLLLLFGLTIIQFDAVAGAAPPPISGNGNGRIAFTGVSSKILLPNRIQDYNTGSLNLKNKVASILTQSANATARNARTTMAMPMSLTEVEMNNISAPRSSWLTLLDNTSSITMDIGIADDQNAQTWTLPVGVLDIFSSYENEDFIPVIEVPEELRFPGVNKVVKTEYEDSEENIIEVYDHYIIDNESIEYVGISYYYYLDEDEDSFDAEDYKFSDVPLEIGDGYTYEESATGVSERNLKYYENDKSVDAFGTLNTPYGAFDCLRISFSTTTYTRPDESSAYVAGAVFTSVGFITEQGHYFTGTTSGTSGSVTIDDIQFQVVAPTGILQDQSEVQINNDGDGVLISNTGVYIDILTKTADENAILDIESDNKGIMIPRLEEANRPASPNEGLLIYQYDGEPGFYYYDGYDWTRIDNTTPSSGARIAAPTQAFEQQEKGIYKKGFGKLVNGSAFIPLKSGVIPEELLIQLQAEGECNGLYISEKTAKGFEVKELQNGKSNTKFSWTLNQ